MIPQFLKKNRVPSEILPKHAWQEKEQRQKLRGKRTTSPDAEKPQGKDQKKPIDDFHPKFCRNERPKTEKL